MPRKAELVGKVFGKLTVISEESARSNGKVVWLCKCDCGEFAKVTTGDLNFGRQKSCGCGNTTHGMSQTRFYLIWRGVLDRTLNRNFSTYARYGARGVTVSDNWKKFETFRDDMLPTYFDGAVIDRIDPEKGYFVENCRWVTPAQNNYNTRPAPGKTSRYKGVSFCKKTSKWKVGIKHKGVSYHLGYFESEDEAALVYNVKAKELFGEHGHINIVEKIGEI